MIATLTRIISKSQADFRLRLTFLWQEHQKKCRRDLIPKNQQQAESAWRDYLAKCNAWKIMCWINTCEGCNSHRAQCVCDVKPTLLYLEAAIRQCAGINPSHAVAGYIHDEDKSGGPSGYRVCGKDSWDNAVRAHEEDR